MNYREYRRKFKRFVQGMITEQEFRAYLYCSLSKQDLMTLVIAGAKNLQKSVAIGEPLDVEC